MSLPHRTPSAPRPGRLLRHLRVCLAVGAWFLAAGSHWELVQCVAWTKMFVGYLQEDNSIGEALAMTFDPDNACSLCDLVEDARGEAQAKDSPEGKAKAKSPGKALLYCQAQPPLHFPVPAQTWWTETLQMPPPPPAEPPTPPPRAFPQA